MSAPPSLIHFTCPLPPAQTPPPHTVSCLTDGLGSQTDRFLNHSWALLGRERHAESRGTAMTNVSLFPSYAMIYDTMVVSDLIIAVYFPSEGEKVKVSDFSFFLSSPSFVSQMHLFFFFSSSRVSSIDFPFPPPALLPCLTHPINILLNSQIQ